MTREEIRKKWKNKEFVEAEGSKIQLHNNETNKFNSQNLSLKNRVNDRVANVMQNNPVSFRDRVETRAQGIMNKNNQLANVGNPILEYGKTRQDKYNEYKNMKRITGKDLGMFAKNLALGGYNGGVSAARQNEYLSQQRSEGYRTFNQIQTRVNEQMKNKTANEKLKYNIEQLNKSKSVNGVLVQEQMKINDTSTMKMYNAEEERINKKIAKNAENTDTVVGKYLAGEIAPSMGQSLVGTGLDIIAPGMGSAYRMLSYSGNYTQDGLLKGMTEDNAAMYGLTMAGVETVMDTIGDKMKGIAIGEAKTAKGLKETIKITTKELGINSFFEGSGEALTEPLQELIASLYGGTADYENISSRMVQSFLAGAVSELLMTGSSLGYGSSTSAMNKIKNGEQVSTKEIASALKEINQKEEVDIKNILKDNLNFAEQSLIQSNSKQIDKKTSNKLENIATQLSNEESVNVVNILKKEKEDMINNSNLTDVQKQKLMEITNKYDLGKGDIKDLINKTSMLEKEQVKTSNKDISQVNQQVIPQEQNQAKNANMKQIGANQNSIENNSNISYNNIQIGEVRSIPVQDILPLKTDGGGRTTEQNQRLKEDIQKNGIKNPIELVQNSDGSYEIENGNHRLQIAQELGIKEVPVTLVESWNNIGIDTSKIEFNSNVEELYRETNNRNNEKVNINNDRMSNNGRSSQDNSKQFEYRKATTGDDSISRGIQEYNDRSSSVATSTKGIKEEGLEQSSSFNIEHKRVELPTNPKIYEDENVRAFKYATDNIDNIMQDDEVIVPPNIPPDEDLPDTMKYIVNKRTKEKVSATEIKDSFMQKFVNKGHYIDKLAKETGNKELTYKYDRTMNAFNEAQYSIGEEQVNLNGEVVGKSLINIFDDAVQKGISEDILNDYLLNKHNISRDITGKNIYGGEVTSAQSTQKVKKYEKQYPELVKFSQEVSKYNENNLKDMANTGMISEATYNNLRALYGDYVPTYRDITEDRMFEDNKVGSNVLGRAVKSNKTILSPKEAMAEQTLAIKKAIRVNELGVELYRTLGKDTEIFSGIEFDNVAMESLQGDVIQKAEDGSNIFTIFINGEMTQFKISDDIYTAFQKDTLSNRLRNDKLAKAILTPVEKISKAQRDLLTTYSVGFAFNNPIKDIQDALINTKYSASQFAKNYTKALYQLGTKGDIYKEYIRNGGGSNTYFDYSKGILPQKTKGIKNFLEKVKGVNEVLEQAPRLAEYMSTIENGGTVSEALYNAAEVTTNFKRGGDITKVANRYGANFLNASVQGLDKQIRNITGQNGIKGYANIIIRGTLLGVVPAIINHLLLKDDEDYEDLPDYIKDGYYLIPSADGKFFRIPKGRVVATLGTVSRNFLELAEGKQGVVETLENSASAVVDNLAPNNPFKENLIAPIIQAKNNKAWYGGEIEGTRLKKLPTAERTDEKTSEISNKISELFNSNGITKYIQDKLELSPKKIDYVLDQYSGGIGDVVLPKFTPYAENNILEDKFTTDVVLKNKNIEAFYAELQNAELSKNSEFATDKDNLMYKYLSTVSKDVSDLYAEKRSIQNSNITDKTKKEQSRDVQKKINEIVKGALNTLEEAKINNSTANFGEIEYIKNKDGEWEKLKEEEKLEGLSTKTYASYKDDLAEATDQKRKIEGEGAKLNNKEKINLIQKNTYTEEEKRTIYANYIGKDDDTYNTLSKLQDGETNIDAYLDYKLQEFTGDEDTSSNIVGKKVSGSSKNKTMEYLRKSSLTDIEKIYIVGTKYANELNESQKEYIFKLVNKKITDEEELNKVLKKFKGLEQHKNGEWHWK